MMVRRPHRPRPGTPTPSPTGPDPAGLAELYGCVYGGETDNVTGGTVPFKTNYSGAAGTLPPYGAHDGGRLAGFTTGQVDWSDGATGGFWPPADASKWINVWNHAFLRSTERRCYFDYADPAVYLYNGSSWTLQTYPSSDTSSWASWIAPVFTFKADAVTKGRATTPGGTAYSYIDMSLSTAANNYFMHGAPNYYFPRLPAGSATAISIQFWARMRPFSGVDASTINMVAGGSGDRYASTTDSGGGANPSIGIPRYKRLPTDSSWRLCGYTTLSSTALLATPPPILAAPL